MTSSSSNDPHPERRETKPFPLVVKPTVASLALRDKPKVENATLIRYVRPNETLTVIDAENPLAKIGVKGQWLQVHTEGGTVGYVAAWFVERI